MVQWYEELDGGDELNIALDEITPFNATCMIYGSDKIGDPIVNFTANTIGELLNVAASALVDGFGLSAMQEPASQVSVISGVLDKDHKLWICLRKAVLFTILAVNC